MLRPRDLMAVADENHFWIARVTKVSPDRFTTITQTSIVYRSQWTGGTDWTALQPVSDRVVSVAASGGNLLLVLSNGQWEIADDSGARTGPTGMQWDEMLAVASDPTATWAVVRWQGATTQPELATTQESSTTQISKTNPTTMAATTEPAGGGGPRLMVSLYNGGKWLDARPLPDGVSDDAARMSLEVVDGLPVLAWVTADGKLCVTWATAARGWTKPVVVDFRGSLMDFKLLRIRNKLALWLDTNSAAITQASLQDGGEVLTENDLSKQLALKMATTMPSNVGARTLVSAFGNLRWIGYAGDQMVEQDFIEDAFPESLSPGRPSVAPIVKPMVILLMPWISGYAGLVVLAILLGVWRRTMAAEESQIQQVQQAEEKPRLAPLGLRLMAGIVDLAPIIAIFVVTYPANGGNPNINIDKNSLQNLALLAVATYVLHTLLAEAICGQSIGKMVFGLRVVNSDGQDVKLLSVVIRNLLRVVDVTLGLPLLIVLITPLRQRVGDIVGGTVVVEREGEEDEGDEEERA